MHKTRGREERRREKKKNKGKQQAKVKSKCGDSIEENSELESQLAEKAQKSAENSKTISLGSNNSLESDYQSKTEKPQKERTSRKFKCNVMGCRRAFCYKPSLQVHIKTKHPEEEKLLADAELALNKLATLPLTLSQKNQYVDLPAVKLPPLNIVNPFED